MNQHDEQPTEAAQPEAPETPEAPEVSEVSEASDASEASEASEVSEAPEASEVSEASEISEASEAEVVRISGRLDGNVLVTGFPGFLAGRLLDELVRTHAEDATFTFLVVPKMKALAEARLRQAEQAHPSLAGRWWVLPGDITRPMLGVPQDRWDRLTETIEVVWHLAAIYDLSVSAQLAYLVNVTGTIHVLELCEACPRFARLNYVSTCYVSGERTGRVFEDELDLQQRHKNHYEETKFWAEVEVQRRATHLNTLIFRPGIVVGDSKTGEIPKYDGPYYVFGLVRRWPSWAPMFYVGSGDAPINLVPVDFVVKALTTIAQQADHSSGKVFQIADPQPMRSRDVLASAMALMGHKPPVASLPAGLTSRVLSKKPVEQLTGIPNEALVYFNHDARYDSTHTQKALRDTDVRCPHLSTYLSTLIDYFERYPSGQ